MHYSGILVVTQADQFERCRELLEQESGLSVHYAYPEQHRFVVVQETADLEAQETGLRRIQGLPGVVLAELSYHYVDSGDEPAGIAPSQEEE